MIQLSSIEELGFSKTKSGDPNAVGFIKGNYYIYIKDETFIIGITNGQTLYVGKINSKDELELILKNIEVI